MEAQAQSLPPPLESLAEKLDGKPPMECKDVIGKLSPEELTAILDALVEFVKGGTPIPETARLLSIFLSLFPQEEVFRFLQRIKTDRLLQQFCDSLADDDPNLFHWVRMSKILLTKSENDFLRQILTILNKKRYMGVPTFIPIGIKILRILKKDMTSLLTIDTTVELRNKILEFLWPIPKLTLRVILGIGPTVTFDRDIWIIYIRDIIRKIKAQQQHSE